MIVNIVVTDPKPPATQPTATAASIFIYVAMFVFSVCPLLSLFAEADKILSSFSRRRIAR